MDLELKGRTCLVSGSSSGIGRAVASLLAEEGARVLLTARSVAALAPVAEEIRAAGGIEPALFEADFGKEKAPERLVERVLAEAGAVDVLINNAGGSRPMTEPDDVLMWEEAFQLNFISARRLGELLLPAMAERGWGRVISVTGAIVLISRHAGAHLRALRSAPADHGHLERVT